MTKKQLEKEYEAIYKAEKEAGGYIDINSSLPYIFVHCSDESEYYFQGEEAEEILASVPDDWINEVYILAQSVNW
jgi:hypothetical protein